MKSQPEIKLAENLRKIMAEKNIRVTALAKRVGMNKSTLHGYCNGAVPRHLLKIRLIADFLGVPFSELIFGKSSDAVPAETDRNIEGRYEVIIRRLDVQNKTIK